MRPRMIRTGKPYNQNWAVSLKRVFVGLLLAASAFATTIPRSFFGMHDVGVDLGKMAPFPLLVHYGSYRFWDTPVQWQTVHICNSNPANCLSDPVANTGLGDTSVMDLVLANLYSDGITDNVMYSSGRVPGWAQGSAAHPGQNCIYGANSCILPDQMNADGSCSGSAGGNGGLCTVVDTWYQLVATYVNRPSYLTNHAHIKYWDPWNEANVDPAINSGFGEVNEEVNATWAQLLRLTEDMRCIIKGSGTIHNYPTAGNSAPCSTYLAAYGWSAIDPTALITNPSISYPSGDTSILYNFLYCNDSPKQDLVTSTSCTWSKGLNWGGEAVDAINVHAYWTTDQPETMRLNIATIESTLMAREQAKPFVSGEGSGGDPNPPGIWTDNYSRAGGIVRERALLWSQGVSAAWYYSYNGLWGIIADGALQMEGIAWNTAYSWLNGFTPSNNPMCSNNGTVYTCPGTLANGQLAQLTWDSQFGPGGTTAPANCMTDAQNPIICGTTQYAVPSAYSGNWISADGVEHPYASVITIGAVPVLLEQAPTGLNPIAVTNAASFVAGVIVPGELATIFGANLTSASGITSATTLPLPNSLSDVAVKVHGMPAPLSAVINVNGQQQINFQVPWEVSNLSTATVEVITGGILSSSMLVPVVPVQPGIFSYAVGTQIFGAILHLDYQLADSSDPVTAGEFMIIYCTGLGQVASHPADGSAGDGQTTLALPTVSIGGIPATVSFSGIPSNSVGVYQLNVQVPHGVPSGNQPVVVTVGRSSSPPVLIPVH